MVNQQLCLQELEALCLAARASGANSDTPVYAAKGKIAVGVEAATHDNGRVMVACVGGMFGDLGDVIVSRETCQFIDNMFNHDPDLELQGLLWKKDASGVWQWVAPEPDSPEFEPVHQEVNRRYALRG